MEKKQEEEKKNKYININPPATLKWKFSSLTQCFSGNFDKLEA